MADEPYEPLTSSEPEPAEPGNRLQLAISVLLAITAVIGAISACSLATTFDDAGDADAAGVTALVNYSDARTRAVLDGLEDYREYTTFRRYDAVANTIRLEMMRATPAERVRLAEELAEAQSNAAVFPPSLVRYLDPLQPGGYDLDRQVGETLARGSSDRDFRFENYFDKADALRADGQGMLRVPLILAASVVLLSLAESAHSRRRPVIAAGGALLAVTGVALLVMA